MRGSWLFGFLVSSVPFASAVSTQAYTYQNVKLGGGGGFVPGIIFNPKEKGLAYARTDIGGAYKLNADDSWSPLLDFADDARWNYWGVDALATDPVTTSKLYLAVGMYTNSWDPNNGSILRSSDYGKTWAATALPFKVGGNMPGRGMGERLSIDPNLPSILYFGARSGNGLYKSTDSGVTWAKVTAFPSTGTYIQDPTDTNGYASDKVGLSWVTFDSTSGTSGTATPRIFVGVANLNSTSVYYTTNGGTSWSAVPGQPTTNNIPHKGVLSPTEKVLYVTFNNQAGPYDGTVGSVYKYNITASTWTNISPPNPDNNVFGFGGLAVDLQKTGTIMVAALNEWWPDGQIWRSVDSGVTWSVLWAWNGYPTMNRYYGYDVSLAPWIGVTAAGDTKQIGWMMECLVIDPFDSNHWLYGTGLTIYGGHDLLKWDTAHNVTLKSLADGIEETSVQALISPPTGPTLLSAIGDIGGFAHTSLTVAPKTPFNTPLWGTTLDIDYAGNKPTNLVRLGSDTSGTTKQIALSTDSGTTWSQDYGAADGVAGGKIALSADGDTVLWRTSAGTVTVSRYTNAFTSSTGIPSGAVIAADKKNNAVFYGASATKFYVSSDNGVTFVASAAALGSSAYPAEIAVNPGVTGDVWVSSDTGLFHTVNSGSTFTTIAGFTQAWSISLGAPKTTGGYPAVFVAAKYSGVIGYFRSDDQGVNWIQINEATHGFGAASSTVLSGDWRTYGRVYIGTNGRGIFYGDATGTAPPTTSVAATTSANTSTTSIKTTSTSTTSVKTTSTTATTTVKTTSTSSTKTSSAATSTATGVAAQYGQCGGSSWTGPTVCVSPYVCTYQNDFYSQCL